MGLKRKFREWQKDHPNFITPDIEELSVKDKTLVELSSGRRMFKEKGLMYGVSPIKFVGGKKGFETIQDKGKSFLNKTRARAYAKKLLKDI